MKKAFITICLFFMALAATAQQRPKLVVGVVADQMRWDYLYRYYESFGDDGFKRLMNGGFNCENTMLNYIPSITAVGHASIFTGTVPAIHGIVGNSFFIDGKETYCAEDNSVESVGSDTPEGKKSPHNMLATTIGDELRIATNFKSKVIGVALKDRAAILPAGHSANAAYWMDSKARRFVSSTYYMQKLPGWVVKFNKTIKDVSKDDIWNTPYGNELTAGMAKAAIEGERLGQGTSTDMLTVSFSCTDVLGHRYGTHHEKVREIYLDLDRRLADLLTYLDNTVGKGQYLLFLTADHGAANGIKLFRENSIPADGFMVNKELKDVNAHLAGHFNTGEKLVKSFMTYKVCIDREAVKRASLDFDEVKKEIICFYRTRKNVAYVMDLENVAAASVPAIIREKTINGYSHLRGGDVQLILQPANYDVWEDTIGEGTTHGAWNPYDAHIPFIVYGWNVPHGATQARTYVTDIVPTVCALIHIQMPGGCIGAPVVQLTK